MVSLSPAVGIQAVEVRAAGNRVAACISTVPSHHVDRASFAHQRAYLLSGGGWVLRRATRQRAHDVVDHRIGGQVVKVIGRGLVVEAQPRHEALGAAGD